MSPTLLVWGKGGWIADQLHDLALDQGMTVHSTNVRMENREEVCELLDAIKPTHVINCAGKTGRPNIDWCEDHKEDTILSNVIGTLSLLDACWRRGIHITMMATGCIYQYTPSHPNPQEGKTVPFKETDSANFSGSFYSYSKAMVEQLVQHYPNCLVLRLRMPVSDDLHPRSFITKISKYNKIVDIPNSHSMLHDMLPIALALAENNKTGVFNFTNPGAISHNECMQVYKRHIDPTAKWVNFSLEEQAKVIKAERSNCELDCAKLVAACEEVGCEPPMEIHAAYEAWGPRAKAVLQQAAGAQMG